MTGVDRYAAELSMALSSELSERGYENGTITAVSPLTRRANTPALGGISVETLRPFRAQAWEQITLMFKYRNRLLLSLCNIGPMFRKNQCLMIADAQFISQKKSYSTLFRMWYKIVLPVAAKNACLNITISQYSQRELEHYKIFEPGKSLIIPCGVDHLKQIVPDNAVFDRLALKKASYFLMIGSLAPHKNIAPIVNCLRGRMPSGTKLVIVGGFDSRVFQSTTMIESTDVMFPGRVSDEELVALYQGAIALLFPSLTEGFGLPPLEAMYAGCPVIATTAGAVPEVCGNAALYVDPLDTDAWFDAVQSVVSNPTVTASLIKRGMAQASIFTWQRSAVLLLDAIAAAFPTARKYD